MTDFASLEFEASNRPPPTLIRRRIEAAPGKPKPDHPRRWIVYLTLGRVAELGRLADGLSVYEVDVTTDIVWRASRPDAVPETELAPLAPIVVAEIKNLRAWGAQGRDGAFPFNWLEPALVDLVKTMAIDAAGGLSEQPDGMTDILEL